MGYLPKGIRAGLETSSYLAPERAAYVGDAHAAFVGVDPETGGVSILRHVVGHDRGSVIDPLPVDGQVPGGFAHGVGYAMYENAVYEEPAYDAEGQPQAVRYHCALVPAAEVPDAELFHIQTPSPLNPLGAKSGGEGGTVPAPAAIAVGDALRPFHARVNRAPVPPVGIVAASHGDDHDPRKDHKC